MEKRKNQIRNLEQSAELKKVFARFFIKSTKAQRRKAGTENTYAAFGHSSEFVMFSKKQEDTFCFFSL
jgi:hypothetical protein